jgi:hypothetical protein
MSRHREKEEQKVEERVSPEGEGRREAQLDEALEDTFPASDPVSVEHSDHAGVPPNHRATAEDKPSSGLKDD